MGHKKKPERETGCDNEAGRDEEEGSRRFCPIYLQCTRELIDSLKNDQRTIVNYKMLGLTEPGKIKKVFLVFYFLGVRPKERSHLKKKKIEIYTV